MAIVVGFIPTPEGHAALRAAAAQARQHHTSLIVVSTHYEVQEKDRAAVRRFTEELATVEAELQAAGLDYEVRTFDRGRLPSEDLLEVAESVAADMVVIGLRQRSAVGKLILAPMPSRS